MSQSIHDLTTEELHTLAEKAIEAKATAYCPYSNFRVGASILLTSGIYFSGGNVEVASTPVGICAERCAIAPAVASMKRPEMPQIRALAVATDISPAASPCGMCRQFIREFCLPATPIYMYDKNNSYMVKTIGELLPHSFGPNDLKSNEGMKKLTKEWEAHDELSESLDQRSGSAEIAAQAVEADGNEWLVDEHGSLQGSR